MTLITEFNTTQTNINNIKSKITEKGVTTSASDSWMDLVPKIARIPGDGASYTQYTLKEVLEGTITDLKDNTMNYIRPYCFKDCRKLEKAQFSTITKICIGAFADCFRLKTLVLPGNFVRLDSINAFSFTNIGTSGYVYVKNDLLTTYRNDPEWSKLGTYVRSIAMYEQETLESYLATYNVALANVQYDENTLFDYGTTA